MADDPMLDDGIVFSMTPDFLGRDRLAYSTGRGRRCVDWRDSNGNEPRNAAFEENALSYDSLELLSR